MGDKYALDKHEIETLKRAIEILNDISCDEYADNIREILEEEGDKPTYIFQHPDEGYEDG